MQTALPNRQKITARISGIVKSVQVVEKARLHRVRRESFKRHGDSAAWCRSHSVPFSGRASHFLSLPAITRALIEKDVVADMSTHPQLWEKSPVVEVCEDRPEAHNLVLNQGLNNLLNGTSNPSLVSRYCAVGTGTTPPAATDTILGSEVKRTSTYLTGSGNCGTSYGGYDQINRRTYDFTEEVSNQNYTELGFSHADSGNLFSRLLISGGTVSVLIGQSLRVVYDLTTTLGGVTGSGTLHAGDWGAVGFTSGICNANLPEVATNGLGGSTYSPYCPDVGTSRCRALSGDFTFSFGSQISGASEVGAYLEGAWGAYTPGSFTRTHTFPYWSAAAWSSSAVRGFVYGYGTHSYAIKLASNQTKTTLQKLKPPSFVLTYTT